MAVKSFVPFGLPVALATCIASSSRSIIWYLPKHLCPGIYCEFWRQNCSSQVSWIGSTGIRTNSQGFSWSTGKKEHMLVSSQRSRFSCFTTSTLSKKTARFTSTLAVTQTAKLLTIFTYITCEPPKNLPKRMLLLQKFVVTSFPWKNSEMWRRGNLLLSGQMGSTTFYWTPDWNCPSSIILRRTAKSTSSYMALGRRNLFLTIW